MSVLESGRGVGGVVGWQGVQLVGVGGRVVRLAGRENNVSEGFPPPSQSVVSIPDVKGFVRICVASFHFSCS